MKIGDLVRNLNSEMRMTGIIVGWENDPRRGFVKPCPIVQWADGRCSWIIPHRVEYAHEEG